MEPAAYWSTCSSAKARFDVRFECYPHGSQWNSPGRHQESRHLPLLGGDTLDVLWPPSGAAGSYCDLISGNWPKLHLICHKEEQSWGFFNTFTASEPPAALPRMVWTSMTLSGSSSSHLSLVRQSNWNQSLPQGNMWCSVQGCSCSQATSTDSCSNLEPSAHYKIIFARILML